MKLDLFQAEIVRGLNHQRNPGIGWSKGGAFRANESGCRCNILDDSNVIKNRFRIGLTVDGVEFDRILAIGVDQKAACKFSLIALNWHQWNGRPLPEVEKPGTGGLICGRCQCDTSSLKGFHIAFFDGLPSWSMGIFREVVIECNFFDNRYRKDIEPVGFRSTIATSHVIEKLARNTVDSGFPRIGKRSPLCHHGFGESFSIVSACEKCHRFGLGAKGLHREAYRHTGHGLRSIRFVAWCDIQKSCVGRALNVSQKGASGGIHQTFWCDPGIKADTDHNSSQSIA